MGKHVFAVNRTKRMKNAVMATTFAGLTPQPPLLFIGVLIAANFWILRPFIPAFVWAVIIVVAARGPVDQSRWRQEESRRGDRAGAARGVDRSVIAAVLAILDIPEQ
jgi:hypothetical protein